MSLIEFSKYMNIKIISENTSKQDKKERRKTNIHLSGKTASIPLPSLPGIVFLQVFLAS